MINPPVSLSELDYLVTSNQNESTPDAPYEQLIEQLEGVVDQIEGGELGLEESIKGYEQGIELVKRARAILDRAEQRITELNAESLNENGE
ncbi:MAG: exodeoxyribonuclease VII small subunit [Phycisphaerae bacterium]|nr:exodeoxyribonuclease VII small subunit [Phycisphaerae bacterium]MBM91491.1 exodeoxyribonuclease VII small subunit [Phycisphaerae bacterium]MBM92639.1 exodeoxyribonuclease VII small subunit [Phycisphaerae bacterium]HCT44217.1 exodeoxyribonuclease VII small subunit [Phycisphaerales bacterium]